jgi:hypothetical protein
MATKTSIPFSVQIADPTVWAPQFDESGNITNFSALPARTWTAVPNTSMVRTIKPILDAGGYKLYKYGTNQLGAVMDNFSGMGWDMADGRGFAHGGGHEGGSDNGVYQIDLNKMKWSVAAYPSHPTQDLTAEQSRFYGEGTHASGAGGTANAHVYPLARSSTGFAIKDWLSFSTCNWYAVTGPERDVTPADIVFANGDPWSAANKHSAETPFPNCGDILFDGRPATRHVYGGMFYSPVSKELLMVVRAYWRCKLDGSGWVKVQNGGRGSAAIASLENTWAQIDEKTGKVWTGGCASGCYANDYYFYSKGLIVDPVTMTDTPTPNLRPAAVYGIVDGKEAMMVNAGDMVVFSFKIGRKIGWWCSSGYGFTYDLDTGASELLHMEGDPYNGDTSEGNSIAYVDHRGELWLFDTKVSQLNVWSIKMDPKPGGPNNSLVVTAKRESLANADKLPKALNGLVYNRLAFWPEQKLLVYFPDANTNGWVCRLS